MLLKVHKDSIGSSHTITQKVTKEKTIDRKLKMEGIDKTKMTIKWGFCLRWYKVWTVLINTE